MKNLLKNLLVSSCVLSMLVTPTSVFANEPSTYTQNKNIFQSNQNTITYKVKVVFELGLSTVTVLSSENGKDFTPISQTGGVLEYDNQEGWYLFYEFGNGHYAKPGMFNDKALIVIGDLNAIEDIVYSEAAASDVIIDALREAGITVIENFVVEK